MESQCSICYEAFQEPVHVQHVHAPHKEAEHGPHTFCKDCIVKSLRFQRVFAIPRCPLCKQPYFFLISRIETLDHDITVQSDRLIPAIEPNDPSFRAMWIRSIAQRFGVVVAEQATYEDMQQWVVPALDRLADRVCLQQEIDAMYRETKQ